MPDVRPYILAATFLLLVVALVYLVFTITQTSRRRRRSMRDAYLQPSHEPVAHRPAGPIDTDLRGLEIGPPSGSVQESLLTPLQTEPWQPPQPPAPSSALGDVTLEERIAGWAPLPAEPGERPARFTGAQPEAAPLMTAQADLPRATPTEPVSTGHETVESSAEPMQQTPEASIVEPVTEPPPAATQSIADVSEAEPGEPDWSGLMESLSEEPLDGQPSARDELEPGTPPGVKTPEAPVIEIPEVPAVEIPEVPAVEIPEAPPDQVEAEPVASGGDAAVRPIEETAAEAPVAAAPPAAEPEPETESPPVSEGRTPAEPVIVHSLDTPAVEVPSEAVEGPAPPRPQAVVHDEPRVTPVPEPSPGSPRPAHPRPTVHVAPLDGVLGDEQPASQMMVPPHTISSALEDFKLEAPVEMWFGDARVGVRPGSATYAKFRKYADVLLGDLRSAEGPG